MGGEFLNENTRAISKVKKDVKLLDLYMAHFMGAGGARKFFKADPSANAALLFPAEARSNNKIFFDKFGGARSISDVYALFGEKLNRQILATSKKIDPNKEYKNDYEISDKGYDSQPTIPTGYGEVNKTEIEKPVFRDTSELGLTPMIYEGNFKSTGTNNIDKLYDKVETNSLSKPTVNSNIEKKVKPKVDKELEKQNKALEDTAKNGKDSVAKLTDIIDALDRNRKAQEESNKLHAESISILGNIAGVGKESLQEHKSLAGELNKIKPVAIDSTKVPETPVNEEVEKPALNITRKNYG